MSSEVVAGIIGGFVGGALGVLSSVVVSYFGPRRLEQWRARRHDEPRKQLLKTLLEEERFPDGRYLETLCTVTGTSQEECRRLLIEIDARGVIPGSGNQREVWALIKNKPLNERP
jgi:ABC-type phosphate transport system auxiliary subunit